MNSQSYGLTLLKSYNDDEDDELEVNDENSLAQSVVEFPPVYRDNHVSIGLSESEESSDESCFNLPLESNPGSVEIEELYEDKSALQLEDKSKMLKDLGILDLAPLEDLKISVPEEECIPIGIIHKIVDPLVIVLAKKGSPAIDLDSVLFLNHGKQLLGQVFDVFGQITEPMYMIRFNSLDHIIQQGVNLGMEVYFAPRTRHTAYVFVDDLFRQKGSDASWEHDQEPPEGCLDYSDDEEERRAKTAHRFRKNSNRAISCEEMNMNPCKKTHTKGRRFRQQGQVPVNPFYMMPRPGYSAFQPPCHNSNASSEGNNSVASSFVYPPQNDGITKDAEAQSDERYTLPHSANSFYPAISTDEPHVIPSCSSPHNDSTHNMQSQLSEADSITKPAGCNQN